MAEMVLTPPLRADGREPNFLQKFGHAFVHGDIFTKLSLFVWGLGYIGHGQLIKALLVTLVQGLGLYFLGTSGIPALKKFGTLGTVQMEMQFNPLTLKNEVNNYDNSFAILLLSVIALVVIVTLIAAAMLVVQSNYALQAQKAAGKKPNNFRQDITLYLNEKFYVTLLTLPVLGVVVFTIIPLFILIAVAFTNYDQQHMPPAALFTWVGLANFASLFGGQSLSLTFSYAFGRVLSWTLVWAFFATFTNFFGGVFLAMLINNKKTKCQKFWRTLFIITIAVPQFVTLLLVRNFFSDAGIFNTMMANAGVTDFLKTIGLLTLMAQCGLHIPAGDGSTIRVCQRVLADIGDEQSIAQSLSTFSSHMTNIVGILQEADDRTLILFDELGAGTDPVEGAALAAAIIESARGIGALVAATTHYAELKVYAMTTAGVENASCEFNVETLAPTYRLILGIPGKSNAFAISRRLGLPEYIIEKAAARLDAENVRFEDVLTKLDQQRQEMEKERTEARRLKLEMEQSAAKAREYRERLEAERAKVVEKAQAEARSIIQEARAASDLAISELKELKKRKDLDWQQVNDGRAEARRLLNEAERGIGGPVQEPEAPPPTREARAGDTVELVSMGTKASVLSVNKDGTLQLQAGILKISARQSEVRVVEGETQSQKEARKIIQRAERTLRTAAPREVDLRGMMTDEAVAALESFLDTAMLGKLETVTIIHGKGTGAVRNAVRTYLKRSRYVKAFRPGRYGEGEDGVTVVELK